MSRFEITTDDAVKAMARSVEDALHAEIRALLMKSVNPIVDEAAKAIARRIRTNLHSVRNDMRNEINTYVVIDGVKDMVL